MTNSKKRNPKVTSRKNRSDKFEALIKKIIQLRPEDWPKFLSERKTKHINKTEKIKNPKSQFLQQKYYKLTNILTSHQKTPTQNTSKSPKKSNIPPSSKSDLKIFPRKGLCKNKHSRLLIRQLTKQNMT